VLVINSFPVLIFDVSQLQVLQCWEHRNAAFRCITGGWTNKKSKLNSSSLQNQNFNHRVVFVVDCYLLLEIYNVLFYLAMSGLYLLWAVICDSKSGMLAEVILVIKPWHSRAV
jgi:hypothetical protein